VPWAAEYGKSIGCNGWQAFHVCSMPENVIATFDGVCPGSQRLLSQYTLLQPGGGLGGNPIVRILQVIHVERKRKKRSKKKKELWARLHKAELNDVELYPTGSSHSTAFSFINIC